MRRRVRIRKTRRPWWRSRRLRRRTRTILRAVLWTAAAGALVAVVGMVYAGPALIRVAKDGRGLLLRGRTAIMSNDTNAARTDFASATAIFGAAETKLRSPLLWPLRVLPIASTHLAVTQTIASTGRQIGDAGYALSSSVQRLPGGSVRIQHGTIPLDAIASAADALDVGATVASDISDQVQRMPTGWVIPPLARVRTEVRTNLPGAAAAVTKAQAAMHGMPNLLGANKAKRYLVAFSNLSELRGSGGLYGYITALDATKGHLKLEALSGFPTDILPQPGNMLRYPAWFPDDFRTQAQILQNINMTTDFPTVGDLLLQASRAKLGSFDGVIAVDPGGVGAVLAMTGPVTVPGWPVPITSANVAQVMQHDVYIRVPDRAARDVFFARVVRTAFERLTSSIVTLHAHDVGAFDGAVQGGHFRMYSTDRSDELLFRVVGLAGNVNRARGASDALSVVSENATGNKEDWYLTKKFHYVADLDARSGTARTSLDVQVENAAPSSGLPDYVIGGKVPGLPRGTNRQILMVVRSGRDVLKRFEINGRPTNPLGAAEGDLRAYRTGMTVPPKGQTSVRIASTVPQAFFGPPLQRTFRLHLLPQAMAHDDAYDVSFRAGRGWHVVGLTHFSGRLGSDVILDVRLAETRRGWIVHASLAPFRLIGRIFHRIF